MKKFLMLFVLAAPMLFAQINNGGGAASLPDQTGNSGKFLTTNGSVASWGTPAGSGDVVAGTFTANFLTKVTNAVTKTIGNSLLSDDGTTLGYTGTGGINLAAGASIGSSDTGTPKITFGPSSITANQPLTISGSTAITPASAASGDIGSTSLPFKYLWFAGDSATPATHNYKETGSCTSATCTITWPDAAAITPAQSIGSTTVALGTGAIASGACGTAATGTITGAATTDVVQWSPNADWSGITGYSAPTTGSLVLYVWVSSANTVSAKQCNPTASSITPGAATINTRIAR